MYKQELSMGSYMAALIENAREQSNKSIQLCAYSQGILDRSRRTRERTANRCIEIRMDRERNRSLSYSEQAKDHNKFPPEQTAADTVGKAEAPAELEESAHAPSLEILYLAKDFQGVPSGYYRIECVVGDSVCLCRCDEAGRSLTEDLDGLVCLSVTELEKFLTLQEMEEGNARKVSNENGVVGV